MPPRFDDRDDDLRSGIVWAAALVTLTCAAAALWGLAVGPPPGPEYIAATPLCSLLGSAGAMICARAGRLRLASLLFLVGFTLAMVSGVAVAGTFYTPVFGSLSLAVVLAGLLLGVRGAVGSSIVVMTLLLGLEAAFRSSWIQSPSWAPGDVSPWWWLPTFVTAGATAALAAHRVRGAFQAADRSRFELLQRHEELHRSEARLRGLIDDHPLAVMVIGLDLTIERVNAELLKLTGAPSESALVGRNLGDFPVAGVDQFASVREGIAAGERVELEATWKSAWGRRVDVRIYLAPIFSDAGAVVGAQAIVEDISEQKRLETQLRQSQKMEAMGRLASGVAHDFGNDLTAILGNAELMRQDLPEEGGLSALLEQIVQAAERSTALSKQLLAFGQTQSTNLQRVEPCQVIEDLKPLLERICGPGVRLELELEDPGATLHLNAAQLEMGLINLATNARDAMPGGGRLLIGCRAVQIDDPHAVAPSLAPGGYVEIRVRDEGEGMDPATCSRIFEPFFTTKEVGRGTGLGLATLHRFVTQSGGAVAIESEVGVGSAFRILLPAAPMDRTPAAESETLLLVEGKRRLRSPARVTLESCGYRVDEVDGLDAAIDRFEHGPDIDLLICDVEGRSARGAGFMARLRSSAPDLPVLLLAPDGAAAGWCDRMDPNLRVLEKPFTPRALRGEVRELLEKRFVAR